MTPAHPVRVAVVGTGHIAEKRHLPAIAEQGGRVELVAAMDVEAQRVKDFCDRHAVPGGYTDLAELLRCEEPDLVHVCTPPTVHVDQAEQCLQAGAWVWIEKPPCLSLAEFDRIEAAERDGGPHASVVFQHRFGSAGVHAAELISSGELGAPLVAHCSTTWYRPQEYFDLPWRGTWASEGGGPTMGHGIHQMDLMLALIGDWSEVTAFAGRLDRHIETEDASVAAVRFVNGALATVVNSVLSPREESRLRVDLTDATVEVTHLYGYGNDDWRYTPAPHVIDEARIRHWNSPSGSEPSSHTAQLARLLDAIEAGVRPPASGADGRRALELVTAMYQSAFTERLVRRAELGPANPFYHQLHGHTPGWAPITDRPTLRQRLEPLNMATSTSPVDLADPLAADRKPGNLSVSHDLGSALSISMHDTELLRYTYRGDTVPFECPAPYLHPLRTLDGHVVSAYRPHDHRWHKGLAMTISHLSGDNFWGGNTYVPDAPGSGYIALPNVGSLRHVAFEQFTAGPAEVRFVERVSWISAGGDQWIDERRTVAVRDVDTAAGSWVLEFGTELTNVRGERLDIGSPGAFGREAAGYSGLFWRGPREFARGTILAADGLEGPGVMGRHAAWLAYTGRHDVVDAASTLTFDQDPGNADSPARWFVRDEPFPAVNPSLAFDAEIALEPGDTLRRRYRVVVATGTWERSTIEAYLREHPW